MIFFVVPEGRGGSLHIFLTESKFFSNRGRFVLYCMLNPTSVMTLIYFPRNCINDFHRRYVVLLICGVTVIKQSIFYIF